MSNAFASETDQDFDAIIQDFAETIDRMAAQPVPPREAPPAPPREAPPVPPRSVWVTKVIASVKSVIAPIKTAVAQAVVYLPAILLAFVIMIGAVAVVFSDKYLANPHFGTIADYWGLILSAYGSAQALAIAAALLLMASPKR